MARSTKNDDLALPESRLRVRDGALEKLGRRDAIVARHDLDDILTVDVTRVFDLNAIPFYLVGGALVLMPLLRFALLPRFWPILLLGLGILYLGRRVGRASLLRVHVGARLVEYEVREGHDAATGFVASLEERLERRRDAILAEHSSARPAGG